MPTAKNDTRKPAAGSLEELAALLSAVLGHPLLPADLQGAIADRVTPLYEPRGEAFESTSEVDSPAYIAFALGQRMMADARAN